MRAAKSLLLVLYVLTLQSTAAFVPSSPFPRTPPFILSQRTTILSDEECVNKSSWRQRVISILPSWLRSSGNKKKRRALASLLVAASFAFSQPVDARSSSKVGDVTSVRPSLSGSFCRKTLQRNPAGIPRTQKLAAIPAASEGFWTKRRVVMVAAGGGTVLGLSLVPPIKDEDDIDRKTPSLKKQTSAPSSITKDAPCEIDELLGGGKSTSTFENIIDQQKLVTPHPPSIEEDMRVILDPSAETVNMETSENGNVRPKGIKAVKIVTPIIEDDRRDMSLTTEEVKEIKVEEIVLDTNDQLETSENGKFLQKGTKAVKIVTPIIEDDMRDTYMPSTSEEAKENKVEEIVLDTNDQSTSQADLATRSKKNEATIRSILEERLRQAIRKKPKETNAANESIADAAISKSKDRMIGDEVLGKEDIIQNTAERATFSKKEEATQRAILEERLKNEAKQATMRKEELSRRQQLEKNSKQEDSIDKSVKQQQTNTQNTEAFASMPIKEQVVDLEDKATVSDMVDKDVSLSNEPTIETPDKKVKSTVTQTLGYRRQPRGPDEEDKLQKKYGALPLKERAYQILVDLGLIDSSPE